MASSSTPLSQTVRSGPPEVEAMMRAAAATGRAGMAVVWVERGGTEPAGPDEGDLVDVSAAARAVLPPDVWDFVQGGSGAERTLRANRSAFDRVALRPRVLVDVDTVSLRTSVLGADWAVPFGVAPMAYHRLAHPDGEISSAGAAGELGTMFCASI